MGKNHGTIESGLRLLLAKFVPDPSRRDFAKMAVGMKLRLS